MQAPWMDQVPTGSPPHAVKAPQSTPPSSSPQAAREATESDTESDRRMGAVFMARTLSLRAHPRDAQGLAGAPVESPLALAGSVPRFQDMRGEDVLVTPHLATVSDRDGATYRVRVWARSGSGLGCTGWLEFV